MDLLEELKRTFLEEYLSASILKDRRLMKSAVILKSKALFALCDLLIFKKYGKLPKNHGERFRILEIKEQKIYQDVHNAWSKYTDTYSKPAHEESYKILNEVIKRIVQDEDLDKDIKAALKG
jgi:hypothetical protein